MVVRAPDCILANEEHVFVIDTIVREINLFTATALSEASLCNGWDACLCISVLRFTIFRCSFISSSCRSGPAIVEMLGRDSSRGRTPSIFHLDLDPFI